MAEKNTVQVALFTNPKLVDKSLFREKESQSNAGVVQPVRLESLQLNTLVKGKQND